MTQNTDQSPGTKTLIQRVWGVALFLAGAGIFFAMPEKVSQLRQMNLSFFSIHFTQFCFYLIGVLLIGGGLKKIYLNSRNPEEKGQD
jgi:hypothetical protein